MLCAPTQTPERIIYDTTNPLDFMHGADLQEDDCGKRFLDLSMFPAYQGFSPGHIALHRRYR